MHTLSQKPHLSFFWKDLEYWRLFCDCHKKKLGLRKSQNSVFLWKSRNNRQYSKSFQKSSNALFKILRRGDAHSALFWRGWEIQDNRRQDSEPFQKKIQNKPNCALPPSKTAFELVLKGFRTLTIVLWFSKEKINVFENHKTFFLSKS